MQTNDHVFLIGIYKHFVGQMKAETYVLRQKKYITEEAGC